MFGLSAFKILPFCFLQKVLTNGAICGIIEIQKKADCHIRSMTVLHRSGNSTPIQPDNRRPKDIITHSFVFCKRFSEYRLFCDGIFFAHVLNRFGGLGVFFCCRPHQSRSSFKKQKDQNTLLGALYFCDEGETVPIATHRTFPLGQRPRGEMDRSKKRVIALYAVCFLRTYRLPPCAKARGNGFIANQERGKHHGKRI